MADNQFLNPDDVLGPAEDQTQGGKYLDPNEVFGPSTIDQVLNFLGKDFGPPKPPQDFSGSYADYVFSSQGQGKLATAIGQGAKQGWGAVSLSGNDFTKTQQEVMAKAGLSKDFIDRTTPYLKGINEALLRGPINALKTGSSILGGFSGGVQAVTDALESKAEQLQTETGPQKYLAPVIGEAGYILNYLTTTGAPELAAAHMVSEPVSFEVDAQTARAHGVVGEGEAGYFNTKVPTDTDLAAREEATKEAGLSEFPAVQEPQTDIHTVARQMEPYLFKQYDDLLDLQDNLRSSISYLRSNRGAEQEANITSIMASVGGDESKLNPTMAARLQNERNILEDIRSGDTPEMAEARKQLQETDYKIRDLLPDIGQVYAHAQDIMMTPEEAAEFETPVEEQAPTAPEKPVQPPEEVPSTPVTPQKEAAVGPSEGSGEGVGKLHTVEGAGPTQTRGLARSVEARAMAAGMEKEFGSLPEYSKIDFNNQAEKIKPLVDNYQEAYDMLTGKKPIPPDILPSLLFREFENAARAKGDWKAIQDLTTNSRILEQGTQAGQFLRGLVGATDSPSAALKQVMEARKEFTGAQKMTASTKAAKDFMKKQPIDYLEFIKSIECDY